MNGVEREQVREKLPKGWKKVSLGNVCKITMGQFPEGSSYNSEKIGEPLLNGPTEFGLVHPIPTQWTTEPKRFSEPGDILFCVRGATTGRKNIADQKYCIGRRLAAIRGNENQTITEFLFYLLDAITNALLNETAGSTFPNLSGEKLEGFKVILPPLSEQKRIVDILSDRLSTIDKARTATEAQLKAAKALPAAYLRQVFDSLEAQKWKRKRLGDVARIVAPLVDPKLPEYGILPHINGENIESGTAQLTYLNTAAAEGMTSGKYLFENGDVLYSKLRPYLRKVVLVDFQGLCSADMYPIKLDPQWLDSEFAVWLLLSEKFTSTVNI